VTAVLAECSGCGEKLFLPLPRRMKMRVLCPLCLKKSCPTPFSTLYFMNTLCLPYRVTRLDSFLFPAVAGGCRRVLVLGPTYPDSPLREVTLVAVYPEGGREVLKEDGLSYLFVQQKNAEEALELEAKIYCHHSFSTCFGVQVYSVGGKPCVCVVCTKNASDGRTVVFYADPPIGETVRAVARGKKEIEKLAQLWKLCREKLACRLGGSELLYAEKALGRLLAASRLVRP